MINLNPFREFRAEQLGKDLWKLYVPGPFEKFLTSRPIVLEGGRGSGKTMFFLCNSWREKSNQLLSEGKCMSYLLNDKEFIGIYYKVDTAFVTAMEGKDFKGWEGVFSTYINVCFVKDTLEFLEILIDKEIINFKEVENSLLILNNFLHNGEHIGSIHQAISICERILDDIESFLNYPIIEKAIFKSSIIGRSFEKFIKDLRKIEVLRSMRIQVFIDEYETLLEYQQRNINTLIKHSKADLIYNIGMRPKGMLTSKTSSNNNEIIQAPHDFSMHKPEMLFDPEGDTDTKKEYKEILRQICKLRLEKLKKSLVIEELPTDIEYYLGMYDFNFEYQELSNSKSSVPFLKNLRKVIENLAVNKEEADFYFKHLGEDVEILNSRLHLCLLQREGRYRPSLKGLLDEYYKWRDNGSKTYDDWLHNTKYGLLFLLAKEYEQKKLYYGFDVFSMLSTGVIRYFLELCEQAFDFAFLNEFNWDKPRAISPIEQSKAARYVSRYKLNDIKGYEPNGKRLRIFVQNLGDIFKELHRNSRLTLGEPEINHFYTKDRSIDDELEKTLNSAVMWGVLQERGSTKEKSVDFSQETIDYHLNRIYCPHFEISYRRKRKLLINEDDLKMLVSGDDSEAKATSKKIIDSKLNNKKEQEASQLSLFDELGEDDD